MIVNGKRLAPVNAVNYLGILLDEDTQWNKQLAHVQVKLNRGIGIFSKCGFYKNVSSRERILTLS